MSRPQKSAVAKFRRRRMRQGIVRVEVQVRRGDVPLVRKIATTLMDPTRETEARSLLRQRFGEAPPTGLKTLLAAAPLGDIDLARVRDKGRIVDL